MGIELIPGGLNGVSGCYHEAKVYEECFPEKVEEFDKGFPYMEKLKLPGQWEVKFMNSIVRIGIIGDYDGRPSHLATEEALKHSAKQLDITVDLQWIPTETLEVSVQELQGYDGLWCAPGSPYKSMNGAINGIRFAREQDHPFVGTCGGFQHAVIEFGRNVLHITDLEDLGFNPYEANDYITALSCSLLGQTRQIKLEKQSAIFEIYSLPEIAEKYNCSFGLNKDFQGLLDEKGFRVIGVDENEEARIMMLENHRFFITTLFQPQLSSTEEHPHPLITRYLSVANSIRR